MNALGPESERQANRSQVMTGTAHRSYADEDFKGDNEKAGMNYAMTDRGRVYRKINSFGATKTPKVKVRSKTMKQESESSATIFRAGQSRSARRGHRSSQNDKFVRDVPRSEPESQA
jgi:hypothetical protein